MGDFLANPIAIGIGSARRMMVLLSQLPQGAQLSPVLNGAAVYMENPTNDGRVNSCREHGDQGPPANLFNIATVATVIRLPVADDDVVRAA